MSFTKLFSSMLDSTVWDLPDHVRIVWITILAMKDQDGVIEASVPGLARRARVTRELADDALLVLSSPDPDSRTSAHEGRRIEAVDGGWRVLNHDKYRDKLDLQDRRDRKAARQSRWRDRQKKGPGPERVSDDGRRDETHVDACSQPNTLEYAAASASDFSGSCSSPEIIGGFGSGLRSDSGGDRSREAGERDEAQATVERHGSACATTASDSPPRAEPPRPDVEANHGRVQHFVELVNAARARVAAHHRITLRPIAAMGAGAPELLARLRESEDPFSDLEHAVAVAEAQAIKDHEAARWLSWSIAEPKAWRAHLAASGAPPPVRDVRVGRVEPTDKVDPRPPWEFVDDE